MDWTEVGSDRAFSWLQSKVGTTVYLAAGSTRYQWWLLAKQAVIDRCDTETGTLQLGLVDGGEFVTQFVQTKFTVSYRKEGVDEAFSFEFFGSDYFWVAIATKLELLHTVDTSVH